MRQRYIEKMKNITKSASLGDILNNLEKVVQEFDIAIQQLNINPKTNPQPLELEDHNFRIDSNGWQKFTEGEQEYLVNPEGNV